MMGGLRLRLVLVLVSLLALTTVLTSLGILTLTTRTMEWQHRETIDDLAGLTAVTMNAALDPGLALGQGANREDLLRLAELTVRQFPGTRVAVVDGSGLVVASWPDRQAAELAGVPMVFEVLRTGRALSWRTDNERGAEQAAVSAHPLGELDAPAGAVLVARPFGGVREAVVINQQFTVLYILLTSVLAVIVGFFLLTRLVVQPVDALVAATERVASGDLVGDVNVGGKGELGLLERSFNRMVERLRVGRVAQELRMLELSETNSKLERAQNEVARSERLATIGQMAAGLAHEVGNPLSAVMGLLELLGEDLEPSERADLVRRVQAEVSRIDRILRELLDYARTSSGRLDEVDVVERVRAASRLLAHHARGRNVEVALEADVEGVHALADPDALLQVLLNLFVNAADAMSGLGRIDVDVHRDGEMVEVQVRDHGTGISPAIMQRLFTPFYTTKAPGTGTGLGLSVSERLVSSMGGRIEVSSSDEGATFSVLLRAPTPEVHSPGTPSGK